MQKTRLALLQTLSLALAVGGFACSQPRKDCTTGAGPTPFAATYMLKPGTKMGTGDCDTLVGETIGLEKYNPARTDNAEKEDFTKARLAIQSYTLGCLASPGACPDITGAPDTAHQPFSLGDFTDATPDDNDVCHVPTLSPAEQNDIKYEWSNVRIFVTASAPGTQMAADLTITKASCSASYSALGVWPAVSCAVLDPDGGAPTGTDAVLCEPPGSGINPDFKDNIICDPALMLCVLKAPPPALR